jgi:hypothetical protein
VTSPSWFAAHPVAARRPIVSGTGPARRPGILGALGFVPIVGSFAWLVWDLWPLRDSSNRAPHDMIAHTHVLNA